MNWLIRCYPRRWRERYGPELEQLVRDLGPSTARTRIALDLVRGAVSAHIRQVVEMNVAQRRTIARTALIAGVVSAGVAVEILLSNVVFATTSDDDTIPVLVSYLVIFSALFLAGLVAARTGVGRVGQVLAGLAAGAMIGLLAAASFAVVDNVWLDVVAQQPTKIDGFAHSGAASMRDFINDGLVGVAVALPLGLGFLGALFGLAGGLAADIRTPRRHPRSG